MAKLSPRITLVVALLVAPLACADILGIKDATLQTTASGGSGNEGGSDNSGGGSSGGSSKSCGMSYKTECLQTCYDTNCCAEQSTCDNDTDCSALLSCAFDCPSGDNACFTNCETAHPNGHTLLSDLVQCGKANCSLCPDAAGDAAIAQFATATCAKLKACDPVSFSIEHGTLDECVSRSEMANRWIYQLPGATWTAAVYSACSTAWAAASCADYLNGIRPTACEAPGTLAIGAACNSSFECQSLLCDTDGTYCGLCVAATKEGDPCVHGSCNSGLTCAQDSTCQRPRGAGEVCTATLPCAIPLACYNGSCVARQSTVGAACDTAAGLYCDTYKSLICYTSEKKCVAISEFAAVGVGCGVGSDGTATHCAQGTCQSGTQKCVALAKDGSSCDSDNGPYCEWPAFCVDGTCQLEGDLPNCSTS